ncbi:MAG: hypothetical protein JNN15_06690, partial [Blastocatellia bacterium]|nr:hypothetical protein [Blastocatellia bacterium]
SLLLFGTQAKLNTEVNDHKLHIEDEHATHSRSAFSERVHHVLKREKYRLVASDRGLFIEESNRRKQLIKEETFSLTQDQDTLYATTRSGVWISSDNGNSWKISNNGFEKGLVPLSIEVVSGDQIYVGTDRHGIYVSEDRGENWKASSNGLPPSLGRSKFAAIKRIVASPLNPETLFASTDSKGVYMSTNRGRSWSVAKMELPGLIHHRVAPPIVTFDQSAPEKIYAVVNFPIHSHLLEHLLYYSEDGGKSWTRITKLEPNQNIASFSVDSGIATVETYNGEKTLNLNNLPEQETKELTTQQITRPGTEADFNVDSISVLHDDGTLYSFQQNDLTNLGSFVTRRFFQRHSDQYDMVIAFADSNYPTPTAGFGAFAYNAPIVNSILGLGTAIGAFNGGPAAYGSRGQLKSFCNMNTLRRYPVGTSTPVLVTNSSLDVLGHEVGHLWGAFLNFDDNGVTSDELLGRALAHWSFFFNTEASVMEGNGYTDLGGGKFRTTSATSTYSRLDRYCQGTVANPGSVFFIKNPTAFDPQIEISGQLVDPKNPATRTLFPIAPPEFASVTVTGTRQDVRFEQILAVEGPRIPEVSPDQANLKVAFVLVTSPGFEPSSEDLDKIRAIRRDFVGYYRSITGGVGVLDTAINPVGGSDIKAPDLDLTSPNGGESVQGGQRMKITWTSSDINGIAKHDLELSLDGGATYPVQVASKLSGMTQSFDFTLPLGLSSSNAKIRLTAVDYAGNKSVDTSGNFVIRSESNPPTIRVGQPNGGELVQSGNTFEIGWQSSDNDGVQSHDIKLSLDGGRSFSITIASGLSGNVQRFVWNVPSTLRSDQARIEITARDRSGNFAADTSDDNFSIVAKDDVPPTVRLTSPNGGDAVQAGGQFTIRWTSADDIALSRHDLSLSVDSGTTFNIPIASGLSATTQSFVWTIPDIETSTARIRITAIDTQNNRSSDVTISDFAITKRDVTAPVVRITSPNGGERFRAGEPLPINWQTTDNVSVTSQRVLLSLDGGNSFPVVVAATLPANASTFTFTIPDSVVPTTTARVRIEATDSSGLIGRATSAANFTIDALDTQAPTVTVLSPNGSEVVAADERLRVSWRVSDNVGIASQDVQLSFDGGANFITVASGLSGTVQEALVDVSARTSERTRVRIVARDARNNSAFDDSDNLFAVITRPSISDARYNDSRQRLTISVANASATTVVEINGQIVTGASLKVNKGQIVVKGDRGRLNLRSGENLVVIRERGVGSQAFRLSL